MYPIFIARRLYLVYKTEGFVHNGMGERLSKLSPTGHVKFHSR